ncbi:MAG: type II toxin-antitoxin system VapB family antitoxin [Candidatus Aminicenantes bacterium]|nr:type II toxin-antitoxin system VapB family antitoxin [Candidatus Aminicenantes bacterium]
MRTTLNLPDDLVKELVKVTGEKNKTLLIRTALADMLKKIKREKLIEFRGKIEFDFDLDELRGRDMT